VAELEISARLLKIVSLLLIRWVISFLIGNILMMWYGFLHKLDFKGTVQVYSDDNQEPGAAL